VVSEFRARLLQSQRTAQNFYKQTFDLEKLNNTEINEKCQVIIIDRLSGLENSNDQYDLRKIIQRYKNFEKRD
jgi:hypothetical protein